jgi:succinyl-diaminopimelate desuccinylase
MQTQDICNQVEKLKIEMVEALMELIRVPAVGPENGGEGELQKAEKLTEILEKCGFDKIERWDAEDHRVLGGKRPNIIAYFNGDQSLKRLIIVTHIDIVPPGEESLWTITKPFDPKVIEDRVYGRGSEDNGQSLVASIFALKALKQLGIKPEREVVLAFVADEEQGSLMGIQHLIDLGIFRPDDLIVVPDSGSDNGGFIEIIEKSILWLRIRTVGKQTHASLPAKGLNANRIGMQVAIAIDEMLHSKYNLIDNFFSEPKSTFEPTKKEKNVDAINIVPGEDALYFDCRILPNYDLAQVLVDIRNLTANFEKKTGATINIDILQEQIAPQLTNGNSEIVKLLKTAIKSTRNIEATVGGIGGGTCAAFFRKQGIPAVVWSTVDEVAHQPNEYAKIQNLVDDAKIFALLAVL